LVEGHNKLAEWSFLRMVNLAVANGKPVGEAVAGLEQLDTTTNSAVLTEKLGDLYAAQGKPSSAAHEYQLALKLDPTPQQKLRLLLHLGEKYQALDRPSDAYEQYQSILREYPTYADKVAMLKLLVPLARKLEKKSDLETYEAQLQSLTTTTK
jgi:tetratricopeptide (TPR) repeat protein